MAERLKKANIVYVSTNEKGEKVETRSPTAAWEIVRTKFAGSLDGTVVDLARSELNADILSMAAAQGISIKLQRADPEAKTVDGYFEGHAGVLENLQNGIWTGEREGTGPRISDLLDAVCLVKFPKGDCPAEQRDAFKAKLLTEEGREVAKKSAKVMAYVEKAKADRAIARAKTAKEAAKSEDGDFDF